MMEELMEAGISVGGSDSLSGRGHECRGVGAAGMEKTLIPPCFICIFNHALVCLRASKTRLKFLLSFYLKNLQFKVGTYLVCW